MLTVEHETAEALRYARMKAYAANRTGHHGLRWLFEILGWRMRHAAHQSGRD